MAAPPPEVTAAVVERAAQLEANLLAKLVEYIRRILALVRDAGEDAVPIAVAQIVDAVEAGQQQVADLTRVYVETVLAVEGKQARRQEPVTDRDALIEQWTDLVERHVRAAEGDVIAEAEAVLRDEVDKAHRGNIATAVAIGYRRIIHPELSRGGTCGLCIAAAHRLYRRADLKPIHDGCNCGVLPVTADADPGKDLNDADLKDVYRAGGTSDGWTLKQVRFVADENGDLQPVRTRSRRGKRKSQGDGSANFETPAGLADRSPEWLRDQIAKTEALKASDWRDKQLARLRAELAKR